MFINFPSDSPYKKINGKDWFKTFRGACIYFVGYVLVATANNFSTDLSNGAIDLTKIIPVDFPGVDEQQIVMGTLAAVIASAIELGRRLMTENKAD